MLRLEKINKKTGNFSLVNIDFKIDKGDYFTLIGESGSGKSMLLEIITGILNPDIGSIFLNGKNILKTPPQKRNIGMVYQKPSLFPHMSVFENISYPLKIRKNSKVETKVKVQKLAEETEITHLLKRNINNLSGGEIQRVTVARTLATNPDILLLDEPLSFLDVQLKKGMSSLLRKLNQNGQTIIHVTHDYEEAIALANKIAIIEKGEIIQSGAPQEVFQNPKSPFVANFIGIKNFYKGHLIKSEDSSELKIFETCGTRIYLSSTEEINSDGYIIIPSEAIIISDEKLNSSAVNNFSGIIKDIYQTKSGLEIVVNIGIDITSKITNYSSDRLQFAIGKKVWVSFKASSITFVKN
jgi:molybdopterin-binding protein